MRPVRSPAHEITGVRGVGIWGKLLFVETGSLIKFGSCWKEMRHGKGKTQPFSKVVQEARGWELTSLLLKWYGESRSLTSGSTGCGYRK